RTEQGTPAIYEAAVSPFDIDGRSSILVTLMPQASQNGGSANSGQQDTGNNEQVAKLEELVTAMSRQLNWERLARHIVSSIHMSLDRDSVLQSTADALARALSASRCLIVR